MPYATAADVLSRYNPLYTMIGTAAPDVTTVDIASIYIADAEGFMNAYIRGRYQAPLQAEPLITQLASDLAVYKILEDRASRVPEIAEKRYTNATSILGMLRDGKMILSSSQTIISSGDWEAFSSTASYHPVFSPVLDPIDQKVDKSYVTAERDLRINDY